MAVEAAQRVREGLADLIRLVNDADTPTADARAVLEDSKAFAAQVAAASRRVVGFEVGVGVHL